MATAWLASRSVARSARTSRQSQSGIEDDDVGRAETDVCRGCGDAGGLSDDAVTGGLDEEPQRAPIRRPAVDEEDRASVAVAGRARHRLADTTAGSFRRQAPVAGNLRKEVATLYAPRGCGGIGRRARFRSVCPSGRGGSSPLIRTSSTGRRTASEAPEDEAGRTRVGSPACSIPAYRSRPAGGPSRRRRRSGSQTSIRDGRRPPRRACALPPGRRDRRRPGDRLGHAGAPLVPAPDPDRRARAVSRRTRRSSSSPGAAASRRSRRDDAGRSTGDRGGSAEVDSVWIHLDPDQRPARIADFGIYGEAADDRRVSTKLELPDPTGDARPACRGRCARATSTCTATSTTPSTGRPWSSVLPSTGDRSRTPARRRARLPRADRPRRRDRAGRRRRSGAAAGRLPRARTGSGRWRGCEPR